MRYDFSCPRCKAITELIVPMSDVKSRMRVVCKECGDIMERNFDMIRVSKGSKQYGRQIISDSLAMNPNQIAEHKRMFPNVQVTKEGQPVFDNFTEHEAYLKKCNIVKKPKSKKKKGKRIA
ncbi:hypothetical protein LCGC14_1311590 [marine sediment metagenome]|uniref:Uncharacterized protein n=1 Tax=marine sediment metagenome TaxID=412755 RepID=A0A0F9KM51_9ZZZZ